jgi:hypothetical protein
MTPRSADSNSSFKGDSVSMPAAAFAAQRKEPTRLTWMTRSNCSSGWWLMAPVVLLRETVFAAGPIPAQFTRMRSWPCAARALAKAASTRASLVTSTWQNTPPSSAATAAPSSALKSNTATFTPRAASSLAAAVPRPDAPPVTTAEMEESSFMLVPAN